MGEYAIENSDGLKGQNNAAKILANEGYDVEMLKEVDGGNGYGITEGSNPDYLIDGKTFDCYTPKKDTLPKKICSKIREKTTSQSNRIVLNLKNVPENNINVIKEYLLERTNDTRDLKRLHELIAILPDGSIETWFLR